MMTPLPKRNKSFPPPPVPKNNRPQKVRPKDVNYNSSDDDADNDARVEALRIGKPQTAKDRKRILHKMKNPESSTSAALLKEQRQIREKYPNLFPSNVAKTIVLSKKPSEVKNLTPKLNATHNKNGRDKGTSDQKPVRATRNGVKRLKLNEDKSGHNPEENEMWKDGMPMLLAESCNSADANAAALNDFDETEMEDHSKPPVLLLYGVSPAITSPSTPAAESASVSIIKEKRLGNSSLIKLGTGILQARKFNVSVGPVAAEEKEIVLNSQNSGAGRGTRTRSSRRLSVQQNENGTHERISVAVTGRNFKT